MADKLVSQDPTKPGVFKLNGPTLAAGGKLPLSGLDTTGAVNGDAIVLVGGVWAPSTAPASADTASNVGAGTGTIFKQKTGANFEFKTLVAGANIGIANGASDIILSANVSGDIVIVSDQKALGTNGGTATAGTWQTHVINTEDADTGGNCTLAANQMTLMPGTYRIWCINSCWNTNRTQARLQNITDATTLILSDSVASSGVNADAKCVIMGRFTLAAAKVLEVQMQVETTVANTGFGQASSFSTETYLKAILVKE